MLTGDALRDRPSKAVEGVRDTTITSTYHAYHIGSESSCPRVY